MAKQTKGQVYDGSQIQVLEGLEPVRKRPGMYIGSTGYDGVHHLIKEIADNCIDEAIAGYATRVEVTLLKDGGVRVADDGRGIPVDKHPKTGKSTLETVLTILHAGGKFGGGGYKVSSGLHNPAWRCLDPEYGSRFFRQTGWARCSRGNQSHDRLFSISGTCL